MIYPMDASEWSEIMQKRSKAPAKNFATENTEQYEKELLNSFFSLAYVRQDGLWPLWQKNF